MANRQFTQANNGLLYTNLNTTFRVGLTHILYGYIAAIEAKTQANSVVDPYAPVLAGLKTEQKPKVNTRLIFNAVEAKLKTHGYTYFEGGMTVDPSYFSIDDIYYLINSFPDLEGEIKGYFENELTEFEAQTNNGIEI